MSSLLYETGGFAFIYARPLYDQQANLDSLARLISEKFESNASKTVEVSTISVPANASYVLAPIIVSAGMLNDSFLFLEGKEFHMDEGRLIFLADLRYGKNAFTLVESTTTFPPIEQLTDLFATYETASTQDFLLELEKGVLSYMHYKDFSVVFSPTYLIDGEKQENFSSSYGENHLYVKYTLENPSLELEQFVFASTPGVYSYLSPKQNQTSHTMRVDFKIANYSDYYDSLLDNDELDYGFNFCEDILSTTDLTFFDSRLEALTFSFSPAARVKFCADGKFINMTLEFETQEQVHYRMIAHEGDYNNATPYMDKHTAQLGYFIPRKGISLKNLENFSEMDYSDRKERWKFPLSRDFALELFNDTISRFEYEPIAVTTQQDVFTKTSYVPLITDYGNITYGRLYTRVW